jgi:outer membrane protein assembly factor BamD
MATARTCSRFPVLPGLAAAVLLVMSGCQSDGNVRPTAEPDKLYELAAKDMRSNNFPGAVQKLEALESYYPFTNAAKQGQLDLMYAYYRNGEAESAIDQADMFIRENPTHPRVDYAYYIRGLVYFESGAGWLEEKLRADVTKRPPHESRKALQSFQILLQQYPRSPYAADTRQRAIFLRNKLADYELAVAKYYMKRQAYVAAVNRARAVIENYDGSPAAIEALGIMAAGYRELEIPELAAIAESVRRANAPAIDPNEGEVKDQPWWKFWN